MGRKWLAGPTFPGPWNPALKADDILALGTEAGGGRASVAKRGPLKIYLLIFKELRREGQ